MAEPGFTSGLYEEATAAGAVGGAGAATGWAASLGSKPLTLTRAEYIAKLRQIATKYSKWWFGSRLGSKAKQIAMVVKGITTRASGFTQGAEGKIVIPGGEKSIVNKIFGYANQKAASLKASAESAWSRRAVMDGMRDTGFDDAAARVQGMDPKNVDPYMKAAREAHGDKYGTKLGGVAEEGEVAREAARTSKFEAERAKRTNAPGRAAGRKKWAKWKAQGKTGDKARMGAVKARAATRKAAEKAAAKAGGTVSKLRGGASKLTGPGATEFAKKMPSGLMKLIKAHPSIAGIGIAILGGMALKKAVQMSSGATGEGGLFGLGGPFQEQARQAELGNLQLQTQGQAQMDGPLSDQLAMQLLGQSQAGAGQAEQMAMQAEMGAIGAGAGSPQDSMSFRTPI